VLLRQGALQRGRQVLLPRQKHEHLENSGTQGVYSGPEGVDSGAQLATQRVSVPSADALNYKMGTPLHVWLER
jgi:hypothetical protein